jgi:hypothetical protein
LYDRQFGAAPSLSNSAATSSGNGTAECRSIPTATIAMNIRKATTTR